MTHFQGTDYDILTHKSELTSVRKFIKNNGGTARNFGFPVIIARRDNEIIGVLGTLKKDNQFIAGPLIVPGNKSMVGFRLISMYESYLKVIGVRRFHFAIDKDNPKWLSMVTRMPGVCCPIKQDAKQIMFERTL